MTDSLFKKGLVLLLIIMLNFICLSTSSLSVSIIKSDTITSNYNTSKYTTARIIFFYSPENEYEFNYADLFGVCFEGPYQFISVAFGLLLHLEIININGTITVKPFGSEKIILNSPGDKVLARVSFEFDRHNYRKDSGFFISRAFGVTVEKA